MEKDIEKEVLTRMFEERNEDFDENASKELKKEKIKDGIHKIEELIKNKFKCDEDTLYDIICEMSEYSNIENEIYYKIGVADGFKLNEESVIPRRSPHFFDKISLSASQISIVCDGRLLGRTPVSEILPSAGCSAVTISVLSIESISDVR